jgi:hypothetical protein
MAGEGGMKPGPVTVSLNITVDASQVGSLIRLMDEWAAWGPSASRFIKFVDIHDINITEERV